MVRLMIGRDVTQFYTPPDAVAGAVVLRTRGLRTQTNPDAAVDIDVRGGEIVGLAGLVGAGRTELARALFGIDPLYAGQIEINGRPIRSGSVPAAIAAGICLVPEDRKSEGLFLDFSLCENVVMPNLSAIARAGFVDRKAETMVADRFRNRLAIRARRLDRAVSELSGGNQQKVVLAKWLGLHPRLIILDEPTRGVDVGAKAEVYRLMRDLAEGGAAVLMISSDMEEVIGVSTRVAVMRRGTIAGMLSRAELTEEAVLRLAVG